MLDLLQSAEIKANVMKYFKEIADVLAFVNRQMILIFKTNDLLRGTESVMEHVWSLSWQGSSPRWAPRTAWPPSSRCPAPASGLSRRSGSSQLPQGSHALTSTFGAGGSSSKFLATKCSSTSTGPGKDRGLEWQWDYWLFVCRLGGILRLRWVSRRRLTNVVNKSH